jgi:hypothetical protein
MTEDERWEPSPRMPAFVLKPERSLRDFTRTDLIERWLEEDACSLQFLCGLCKWVWKRTHKE